MRDGFPKSIAGSRAAKVWEGFRLFIMHGFIVFLLLLQNMWVIFDGF